MIPKDWNLKELNRGQKSWITKLANGKFKELVKRPGEFTSIKVSTKEQKHKARSAGLPVVNGRAFTKAKSVRRNALGELTVTRQSGTVEHVYYADSSNFLEQYDRLSKIELAPNQLWKLRIEGNLMAHGFRSFDELIQYARGNTDMDLWNDEDEDFAQLDVAFVIVTVDRPNVVWHHPDNIAAGVTRPKAKAKKSRNRYIKGAGPK